ncbi:hypothetical protein BSKO_10755 [Bryopsis sp. KO-2023]|nr:hypothetical protein BSKO_10755 [Bryopsis sp. KO-2023]
MWAVGGLIDPLIFQVNEKQKTLRTLFFFLGVGVSAAFLHQQRRLSKTSMQRTQALLQGLDPQEWASIPPQVSSLIMALVHDVQAQGKKLRDISEKPRLPGYFKDDKENALRSIQNGAPDSKMQKRVQNVEVKLQDSMNLMSALKSSVEESRIVQGKLENQMTHLRDSMKEAITASSLDVLETAKKIVSAELKAFVNEQTGPKGCSSEGVPNKLEADVIKLTAYCEGFEDRLNSFSAELEEKKLASQRHEQPENFESKFRVQMAEIHERLDNLSTYTSELGARTGGSEKAWKSIRKTMEDTLLDVKVIKNKGKQSNSSRSHQSVTTSNGTEEICGEPGRVDQIETTVLEVQKQTKKLQRAVLGSSMRSSLTHFIANFPKLSFPDETETHSSSLATQLRGLQSHVQDVTSQVNNLANMFFELEDKMESPHQPNAPMSVPVKSIKNDTENNAMLAKDDAPVQNLDPDIYKKMESMKAEVLAIKCKQDEMHSSFRNLLQESVDIERLHTEIIDLRTEMQQVDEKMEEYPTTMQVVELANLAVAKSCTSTNSKSNHPPPNPANSANHETSPEESTTKSTALVQELAGRLVKLDQKIHHIYKQHNREVNKRIENLEGLISRMKGKDEIDPPQSSRGLREEMYESFRAVNLRLVNAEKKGEDLDEVRRLLCKISSKIASKVDAPKLSHYLQESERCKKEEFKELHEKLETLAREQSMKVDVKTLLAIAGPTALIHSGQVNAITPRLSRRGPELIERSPPLEISLAHFGRRNDTRGAS